jgi:hypothetical protein
MPDSSNRKVVCVEYETGKTKTIKKNGRDVTVPETKLLTVGSAFLTEASDENANRWMIQGRMRATPPQWDGKFVLLDPLPRNGDSADDEVPY